MESCHSCEMAARVVKSPRKTHEVKVKAHDRVYLDSKTGKTVVKHIKAHYRKC